MDQECPNCRLICAPSTRYCDCGFDFVNNKVDNQHAPKYTPRLSPRAEGGMFKLALTGLILVLGGFGYIIWVLSEGEPAFWNIVHAGAIGVFGVILFAGSVWMINRS